MAAPLHVDTYRVEHGDGYSVPCITLPNRRAAGNPVLRFLFQRDVECVLWGRTTSGPIYKVLNTSGLDATALQVSKANVTAGLLLQAESDQIMTLFRSTTPADVVDPCSLGRIRTCTLLPFSTAAAVARAFGRSGGSMAFLSALSMPVPEAWRMREEQEQNEERGEVDLVLNDMIEAEGDFEAEDLSFAEELTQMPAFSTDRDDEERMKVYIMQRPSPILLSELRRYIEYRTAVFVARRQGGAVQSISAEADKTALLRFFGYLERTQKVPEGASLLIDFLNRADLGDLVADYATWLQHTQRCKFSSIANYLNGLVSLTMYAYAIKRGPWSRTQVQTAVGGESSDG